MRVFLPFLMVATVGCTGDDEDKETGEETGMVDDTAPPPPPLMYNVQASFLEAIPTMGLTPAALAEGLCATLIDPTPVISGGDALDLATGTLDSAGQVTFENIEAKPTLGMIVTVDDCPDSTEDIINPATSTGILNATYADAKDGDTVPVTAFGMDPTVWAGFELAAAPVEFTAPMMGYVLDGSGATPVPVAGVTIGSNPAPENIFYLDANTAVEGAGPFAELDNKMMPVLNTETQAPGVFLIANAEIVEYSATDASGALEFGEILFGGFAGQLTVIAFFGAPPAM